MQDSSLNRRLASILIGALALTAWSRASEPTLDIYWPDVEGGGGTLIKTPAGESILVDTGMPGERDPGRIRKVAAEVAGLKQIDHLVTTHFDIDHYGGAADLAKLIPIGCVYDHGLPERDADRDPSAKRFQAYREFKATRRVQIHAGDQLTLRQTPGLPPVVLRCVAAQGKVIAPRPDQRQTNALCAEATLKAEDSSENVNSVALVLEFGSFRFFDGADLTWNIEGQLVCPLNRIGAVDVYQVDHHGFDISNNSVLVRSLAPTVSVMVNGTRKGCEPGTVATLRSTPSIQANYQLHRNLQEGQSNTADDLIANQETKCSGNYIKCCVAADAKSYTVTIPGTGHHRTFQTKDNK
jgi:competence protein ComEC